MEKYQSQIILVIYFPLLSFETDDMYFVKTPKIFPSIFPCLTWKIHTNEPILYLTFDDGPSEKHTDWILQVLDEFNCKATFFCIGKNVELYPEKYKKIIAKGHQVGNHTFNHIKGWGTADKIYLDEVEQCSKVVNSKLFRPPYGRIDFTQSKALIKLGYEIIMWDVLSGDFDENLSTKKCLTNITSNIENGSIIVLHDSEKAAQRMKYVFPRLLEFALGKGYSFDVL